MAQTVAAPPGADMGWSTDAQSQRTVVPIVGRCRRASSAPRPGARSTTLPALDSMRAVAAVAVLATHASFWGGAYAPAGGRHGAGASRHRRRDLLRALRLPAVPAWLEHHARRMPPPPTRRLPVAAPPADRSRLRARPRSRPGAAPGQRGARRRPGSRRYAEQHLPRRPAAGRADPDVEPGDRGGLLRRPAGDHVAGAVARGGTDARSRAGSAWSSPCSSWSMSLWLLDTGGAADSRAARWPGCGCPSYLTWFAVGLVIAAACYVHLDTARDTGAAESPAVAQALRQMGRAPGSAGRPASPCSPSRRRRSRGRPRSTAPRFGEALTKNLLYAVIAGSADPAGRLRRPRGRYIRVAVVAAPAPPRPHLVRRLLRPPRRSWSWSPGGGTWSSSTAGPSSCSCSRS